MRRSLIVLLVFVSVAHVDAQRARARRARARPAVAQAASSNPIVASRVPSNSTTLPDAVWAAAGTTIPTNRTQCGSTVSLTAGSGNAAANTSAINTAIGSCTANKYVLLPSGTYYYNGFKVDGQNNITVRGAGPGSSGTILILGTDTSCRGYGSIACVINDLNLADYIPDNPNNIGTWSAGYTRGTLTVTVTRISGSGVPTAGMDIHFDQTEDGRTDQWPTELWDCGLDDAAAAECSDEGGGGIGRSGRRTTETHQIASVTGTNPYTITLTTGLIMDNWSSGKTPQAYWSNITSGPITGVGIENIYFDASGYTGCGTEGGVETPDNLRGIVFFNARDSWVKNIRVHKPCRGHVLLFQSTHMSVVDSYFEEGQFHKSRSYGIEDFGSMQNLYENNIFQRVAAPIMRQGAIGSVARYNYQVDDGYDQSLDTFMQAFCQHHTAGTHYNLCEGNDALGMKGDIIHGTTHLNTSFRNYWRGWDTNKTNEANPVKVYANDRYWNIVGDVLGTSTYHTAYGSGAGSGSTIYSFGEAYGSPGVPADSHVAESVFRWGNYNTVQGTVRWCGNSSSTGWVATCSSTSEVPTTLTKYAQTVPSTETLPNSLSLSAQPSWWASPCGTPSWPPMGPDVSGGAVTNVGGHVHKIPARLRYENGAKDGSNFLTNYDATTCN